MKKSILVFGLSLVLLAFSGSDVFSQASKEITEPITLTFQTTSKAIPMGEASSLVTFDALGVLMSDDGKGLFHEATLHAAGAQYIEKGVAKNFVLYGYYLLKNGDKVLIKQDREEYRTGIGIPYRGKITIIGGTGKCAGIQGSWEFTGVNLRPAAEGTGQGFNKHPMKYTLP